MIEFKIHEILSFSQVRYMGKKSFNKVPLLTHFDNLKEIRREGYKYKQYILFLGSFKLKFYTLSLQKNNLQTTLVG